jgi:flagellar protein FlaG
MDVQAAATTATVLSPSFTQIAPVQPSPGGSQPPTGSPVAPIPSVAAAPSTVTVSPASGTGSGSSDSGSSGTSNGASSNAIGPTPGLATLPAGPPDGTKKGREADTSLAGSVATLYNVQQQNISVSFQINQDPNEIVTVFTDKQTGKVIVQFPSETMIALAKLFDKLDGSVVNKKV